VHLAHAAGAEPLLQPVLAQLFGRESLAAQRADRLNADDSNQQSNHGNQNLRADEPAVLRLGYELIECRLRVQIRYYSDWQRADYAQYRRRSLPGIRNEHCVRENQQEPGSHDRFNASMARGQINEVKIHVERMNDEEQCRAPEDHELSDAKLCQ